MCHLGCFSRMCLLPPSLLLDVVDLQPVKFQAVLTLSTRQPWQGTLACHLGHFGGTAPGSTLELSVLCPGHFKGMSRFFFGREGSEHLSRWVSILLFCQHDLCGHPFPHFKPWPCNHLGQRSLECFWSPSLPLPSDNLNPPQIPVRWATFRGQPLALVRTLLGQVSSWPVLLPQAGNC